MRELLEKLLGTFSFGRSGSSGDHPLTEALKRHLQHARSPLDLKAEIGDTHFVAFDMELTGQDFRKDSIVSMGALRMRGSRIYPMQSFHCLVKPESELKGSSVVVHGITHTDLEVADSLEDILDRFLDFLGDAVLVGHQVRMDMNFLGQALQRLYGVKLQSRCIDTLSLHEWLTRNDTAFTRHHRGYSGKGDLIPLARHYGIEVIKPHNAFFDAYLAAQLFQRFLYFLPGAGVRTLGDLLPSGKP